MRFKDVHFNTNFLIVLHNCKSLALINCTFDNLVITGNFESIYFDSCDGTISNSSFYCNHIHVKGKKDAIIQLLNCAVYDLKKLEIRNSGHVIYSSYTPLIVSNIISLEGYCTFTNVSSTVTTNLLFILSSSVIRLDKSSTSNIPKLSFNDYLMDENSYFDVSSNAELNSTMVQKNGKFSQEDIQKFTLISRLVYIISQI